MTDDKKHSTVDPTHTGKKTGAFDKKPLPDKIGHSLKSLYDEVLAEDVPDDFLNLLRQADASSEASK